MAGRYQILNPDGRGKFKIFELTENGPDDVAVDIGEPATDAVVIVGEFLVVEAKEVEGGGVEVVDGDGILGGLIAKFVGDTVGGAGLDAGAREPAGEAVGVMVAAFFAGALRDGGAAEFGDAHDEGVLEQAAFVEVL
jgi:hypothetical protein